MYAAAILGSNDVVRAIHNAAGFACRSPLGMSGSRKPWTSVLKAMSDKTVYVNGRAVDVNLSRVNSIFVNGNRRLPAVDRNYLK